MTLNIRILLAFVALLTLGHPSLGQQSGLLLGLRVPSCSESDPHCKPGIRTLWIAPQDGAIKLVAELPDLIVPRSDGFWRVGVRNYCDPPDSWSIATEDIFFAVPVNHRPSVREGVISCIEAKRIAKQKYKELVSKSSNNSDDDFEVATAKEYGPAYECSSHSIAIEFVNSIYVSTTDGDSVECGAHPDGDVSYHVSRLGSSMQPGVTLSSLFGDKATAAFMDLARQALVDNANANDQAGQSEPYQKNQTLKELSKQNPGCFPDNVDDQEWHITRSEARWIEQGGIGTHRLCGVAVEFPLPPEMFDWSRIDKSVPVDMKWLRSLVSDTRDAFWSPRKDLLVLLTRHDSLLVFEPVGEKLGSPLLTLPVTQWELPVMAEWALGTSVERWTHELTTFQQRGFPEPLVLSRSTAK